MRTTIATIALAVIALFLWGCSSSNNNAPALDASGKHPANWIIDHRAVYQASVSAGTNQCNSCHGADLRGGVSGVSCFSPGFAAFTCHPHPVTTPPWSDPVNHGAAAISTPGLSGGFSHCRACHGATYRGGTLSTVSCFSSDVAGVQCHAVSPHPPAPWRDTAGTGTTHTAAALENAPQCAECHLNNQRLTIPVPVPAGTTPTCFNGTMCHGAVGHPVTTPLWSDPTQHGATAKLSPSTTGGISAPGFDKCQDCHGQGLRGGSVTSVSCFSASVGGVACHATSPHPPGPWRTSAGSVRTHTNTDEQQARVCGGCHLNNQRLTVFVAPPVPSSLGCFNSTLCHGPKGHEIGWANPTRHGAEGKADLTRCQVCHAQPAEGGPGSNPRFTVNLVSATAGITFNCETCHGANTAHPPAVQFPAAFGTVSSAKINRPWFTHRTAGNFANACSRCHGANLDGVGGVGPACFNPAAPNTSCHITGLPFSVTPACTSCHGSPPVGSTFPNREGAHSEHNALSGVTGACSTCHNGFGSGTVGHFTDARPPRQAPADVAIVPNTFNAQSGVASFSAASSTCTNVSCHGGQPTPNWASGAIDIVSQCTLCHELATAVPAAGASPQPQFNSFFSGRHKFHVSTLNVPCRNCHDMDSSAPGANQGAVNHFRFLATPAMEGPARATIRASVNYDTAPAIPTCTPPANEFGFALGCHIGSLRLWSQQPLP